MWFIPCSHGVGGPLPLCQDADGDNCKVASNMLQVVMPRLIWGSPLAYAEKGPVTSSVKIGDIIPTKTATKEKKLVWVCAAYSIERCYEFVTSAVDGPGQSDLHCILYSLGKKTAGIHCTGLKSYGEGNCM